MSTCALELGTPNGRVSQCSGGRTRERRQSGRQPGFDQSGNVHVRVQLIDDVVCGGRADRAVLKQLGTGLLPIVGVEQQTVRPDREHPHHRVITISASTQISRRREIEDPGLDSGRVTSVPVDARFPACAASREPGPRSASDAATGLVHTSRCMVTQQRDPASSQWGDRRDAVIRVLSRRAWLRSRAISRCLVGESLARGPSRP
jgi:hypothetical protein